MSRFCAGFRIPLRPRGQGRARISTRHGFVQSHKHAADRAHEASLAALAARHAPKAPLQGPVSVLITAIMPRTKHQNRVSKRTGEPLHDPSRLWHTSRPDADNIAKGVLDALKAWWTDDAQVCSLSVAKRVCAFGEEPHYWIEVEALS